MIFVILFTCLLTVYWFCKEKLYVPDLFFLSIGPFSPAQTSNPDIFKDEHVRRKQPETSSNSGERVQSINQSYLTNHSNRKNHNETTGTRNKTIQTEPSAGKPADGIERGKSTYAKVAKSRSVLCWPQLVKNTAYFDLVG